MICIYLRFVVGGTVKVVVTAERKRQESALVFLVQKVLFPQTLCVQDTPTKIIEKSHII